MLISNHLKLEHSPYLLQHASNPVDWYPWGKKALDLAKALNKPILLSIGYAACHWCHVMAHESFEDEETAQLMNELFINIKVDKEERPDLDKVYQVSHYLLSHQSGGWPLTIFLTPSLIPIFSGTYFPRDSHWELPTFKKILRTVADVYRKQPEAIQQQENVLKSILHKSSEVSSIKTTLTIKPIQQALFALEKETDPLFGGFSAAPKFPQPTKLAFALKHRLDLAYLSLLQMAKGGLNDQLGGGFFRYTVDRSWQIPHFEKMLSDNAQLLLVYVLASKCDNSPYFAQVGLETARWIISMQAKDGGYYSSIDADSEGEEGKFYLWDKQSLQSFLTYNEFAVLCLNFGLDKPPNFALYWHLYQAHTIEEVSSLLQLPITEAQTLLKTAKIKLLAERKKRIAPNIDKKVLTSWNALAIKSLYLAGYFLKNKKLIDSAEKALQFIQTNLWKNGKLMASYKDKTAYLPAYLDDYVFLLDAILASLEITWDTKKLATAINITELVLKQFYDEKNGGFFFTANDHEQLFFRPKTIMDEALPAANGILVQCLVLLDQLLGETRYLQIAKQTLESFWPFLANHPGEHCSLLLGLQAYLHPFPVIILRGEGKELAKWHRRAKSMDNHVFPIPNDATDLPRFLANKKGKQKTCAFVCQGLNCQQPITTYEQLKNLTKRKK